MKKIILRLNIILLIFSPATTTKALDLNHFSGEVVQAYLQQEESASKQSEKSYTTALLLGWSPITGDGLYYTGHPVQGTLALLLGIVGAVTLIGGITDNCVGAAEIDDCQNLQRLAISIGVLMYGSAYLWDGFKTTSYAQKYKE